MTFHTDETKHRVAELWATGMSGSQIGRQIGITKNAVIGLATRMGLPRRAAVADKGLYQPISDEERQRIIELRALHVSAAEISRMLHRSKRTIARVCANGDFRAQAPRPRQERKPILPVPPGSRCLYLLGERDPRRWIGDERVSYLRCDAPAVRGSYCSAHAARCYYRAPPRQLADAAA